MTYIIAVVSIYTWLLGWYVMAFESRKEKSVLGTSGQVITVGVLLVTIGLITFSRFILF